jgi:hypothetical protein
LTFDRRCSPEDEAEAVAEVEAVVKEAVPEERGVHVKWPKKVFPDF